MSPTIPVGSTADYQRGAGGVVRGDVVVIHSPSGLLVVPFNSSPSQVPFAVTLGAGQMWVMTVW